MKVLDITQRTPEWHLARVGRLTGTGAKELFAKGRSGAEAVGRRDLRIRLALERLTGQPQEDGYVNAAMQRGVDKEPEAIAAYEARTGLTVWPVGFLQHDDLLAGCSPDGTVSDVSGLIEAKCPKSATHLEYLRAGAVPPEYMPQVTHNLWISGAAWCDFVSFDDRFPADLQLVIHRVKREAVDMAGYEALATAFLAEVDREWDAIQLLRKGVAA